MELKVWVEGMQRIVCGVTEHTTCQDVVYALAHATGKTGRFTLIERWRNNDRLLSPTEQPLQVLLKWGEYSSDVQFVLQRSQLEGKNARGGGGGSSSRDERPREGGIRNGRGCTDIKKSLTFSGGHHSNLPPFRDGDARRGDNVGVVRGVPQRRPVEPAEAMGSVVCNGLLEKMPEEYVKPSQVYSYGNEERTKKAGCQLLPPPYREPPRPTSPAERDSPCRDRPKELPPYRNPPPPPTSYRASPTRRGNYDCTSPSSSPSLPVASRGQVSPSGNEVQIDSPRRELKEPKSSNTKQDLLKDFTPQSFAEAGNAANNTNNNRDPTQYDSQCQELLLLVKHQREKLNMQQSDLTKCNEEILYRETKLQEQKRQLEYITKETEQLEKTCRQNDDQSRVFGRAEAEHEVVKQQEKTLESELTLLRSKLANSETELLQYRNKIRLLVDQVQDEQRYLHRDEDKRKMKEGCILDELESLQRECEQAKTESDAVSNASKMLLNEEKELECAILKKNKEVELLVQQMKEVNLQGLGITPTDELHCLLDGPHKAGNSRKIIGSPRQLENAFPTSKNPLGVWV